MNVTELARRLRINSKELLEILPEYGFDIGKKAIKVDDRTAQKIMKQWRRIKKDLDRKKREELELKKQKERELRRELGKTVTLPSDVITVKDLAETMEMPVTAVITELMKNGVLANQNQNIDYDTAAILAREMGFTVEKDEGEEAEELLEDERAEALEKALEQSSDTQVRPPVIVVMGHVDHGKTKLLDTIRQANIIDTEAGGITQHIGAYQTVWKDPKTKDERKLTFIDTPGHEAFTVMRSRGAKVADIGILVVAADDGVKPQTEEVIQILKAAKLPFVVAINKIDKETADPQKVKTELSQRDIITEEWGGEVPMVEISAKEHMHIDKLLDVLLLVADVNRENIQADPSIPAIGTVIESHVDKHMGPVATVLIQAGTLMKGEPLVVNGEIYGKVRAMKDYHGEQIDEAGPSTPAQIIGFKVAPEVGDVLNLADEKNAERIDVKQKKSEQTGAERSTITGLDMQDDDDDGKTNTVNLVIKADVLGSLEAIIGSLAKLKHDEVGVKIVGKGLGNITEDDVNKAEATGATVVAFNVNATPSAEDLMREKAITFLQYSIIYDLIDYVKEQMEELLEAETIVTTVGRLEVLAIFRTDKKAMTVGGRVKEGKAVKDAKARIYRGDEMIGRGKIVDLQQGKQSVKEVPSGTECGLRYEGKVVIEKGDTIEFYTEEKKDRALTFDSEK